ncbi:MAG: sigma-70 family RNA polymerase sigma factor [Chitinophagaceae bacterium]|nr:sigma-70 family RNA polymerase sigma factor [Chitinophagaceae bacterium]
MLNQNHTEQEFLHQVDAHKGMIHKVCHVYCHNPGDRDDLFQEIVIQLWKAWPGFRGESRFSTWMYRIALNTAISGLRRNRHQTVYLEPGLFSDSLRDESDTIEKEEKLATLYAAIRRLSELERAMIMLYLEDKTYEEMEEILGVNQNSLRVKMNRAKEKLRRLTKPS